MNDYSQDPPTESFKVNNMTVAYTVRSPVDTHVVLTAHREGQMYCLGTSANELAEVVQQFVERGLVRMPMTIEQKRQWLKDELAKMTTHVSLNAPSYYTKDDEGPGPFPPTVKVVLVIGSLTSRQMKAVMALVNEVFQDDEVVYR